MDWLPKHKAGLSIEHNPHKGVYETIEENDRDVYDWISDEERKRAIDLDSLWVIHWYPDTPVGFNAVAASSLEALEKYFSETKPNAD